MNRLLFWAVPILLAAGTSAAQPAPDASPAAPAAAQLTRDAAGRAIVRATRLASPLRIDGKLDEAVYATVAPVSNFIQQEPLEGQPASERTEVWVLFDGNNVYVAARCYETRPDRAVANELRRDNLNVVQNDNFGFLLDTFGDRRNGVLFQTTPLGTRVEGQTTNERDYNGDWNPIWDLSVGRFAGGWTVEAAIPFKSLRYNPGAEQEWGVLIRRINKWKNEISYNVPVPAARGINAALGASLGAALVGLEAPPNGRTIEAKPFIVGSLTTDRQAPTPLSNSGDSSIGLDVKLGITENVTLNATLNTDFAQVEADEQQINLTRFNLFFPEKREFFLENQGIFAFGGAGLGGGSDTPVLFYSRAIGLSQGRPVPIEAGARVTGRVGRFTIGGLNIQSGDDTPPLPATPSPATNFTVVRVKRDVFARSSIGALYTGRSKGVTAPDRNDTFGLDGTFNLFTNLSINAYWAKARGTGASDRDMSYRGQIDYQGDRYGATFERLVVDDNFAPEVGFVRRSDMRKTSGLLRFSPRTPGIKAIRKLQWSGNGVFIRDGSDRLESRALIGEFDILFQNSDIFNLWYERDYEFVPRPFAIAANATLPVDAYGFGYTHVGYQFGRQRPLSGTVSLDRGTFYNGHKTTWTVSSTRITPTARLSAEPSYSLNRVELVQGSFTTHLAGARVTYTMTPLMFASALLQYNSSTHDVSANVRLRWEYQPGSELFVVYNEHRDTTGAVGFPDLANRSFIVKVNKLFRL